MTGRWVTKALGDVCVLDRKQGDHQGLPYVGLEDIQSVTGSFIGPSTPRSMKGSTFLFEPGHVLFGRLRPYLNKTLVPDFRGHCSTELMPLKHCEELDPHYLRYWLSSAATVAEINATSTGARMPRANMDRVMEMELPVPPLSEQKRIVRILDDAFVLVDGTIENTQQIQTIAEDLFRSELTATVSQLNRWPKRLLPEIASEFGRGRSRHRPRNAKHLYGGPYPFIQTGDIRNSDHWIENSVQSYSEAGLEQSKLWPAGTVCITIAANIAESGILRYEACFPDSVIGAVLKPDLMDPEFLEYLIQADKATLQAKGKGTAQDNINLGTFRSHPYPVPPLPEQQRVVARLSALREALWRLSNVSSAKLIKLSDLRQSLLQQAFSSGLSLEPRDVDVSLGGVRT
mgnify:CR=1 FL=1